MKKGRKAVGTKGQENEGSLLTRLNTHYDSLSKGKKRLADYIYKNYDKAVFMTAAQLGAETNVSESTTVRFASQLGYSGFPEFHRDLEALVRNKLNSVQRMEVSRERISEGNILTTVMQADIEKINQTLEHADMEAFRQAVETLSDAEHIYIIGVRSCASLASFLGFYLNQIAPNVHVVTTNSSSEVFEQIFRICEKDAIIGISFPRYSMRTLKAMEFANNRNARVITITDNIHSPMTLYSSCNLIARSDMASIVDSLVAPLSMINALIVAMCMKHQTEVMATLETMEKIWAEYQVYSSDEINVPGREVTWTADEKADGTSGQEKEKT